MKITRYTYTKQRYVPPIVEVQEVDEENNMLHATGTATGDGFDDGDDEGGNSRGKEGLLWDFDDSYEDISDYEY